MPDEEEVEYVPGERSQQWLHEAHVAYLEDEYPDLNLGRKKPNEVIAIAFATRRDYRASEIYAEAKEAHEAEAEEAKAAAVEEREARAAERAAAAEEKKAARAEKGPGKAKAKSTSRSRPAAKKGAAAKKTTTRTRTRKTKEEDPFD